MSGYWSSGCGVQAVLEDPQDPTELCLLFANKTAQDILLRERLEAMAQVRCACWGPCMVGVRCAC